MRKPLRTAGGVLCIGTEITAEKAMKWPKQNRMAMARTEHVFWYPAPQPAADAAPSIADGDQQPALLPGGEGMPVTAEGGTQAGPAEEGQSSQGTEGEGGGNSAEGAKPELSPIDPETADRKEMRDWLIKTGDEPAPALGDDKLRQRVRDKLAALAAEQNKEG
ncbi:hypothetical protein D3867_36605 (plasmid) [Azospirillum argentinense]|uniref:Uncharacterized protein n=1 Tax=Azospirillum brasilense TaxID=192 RepID=A0A4D8QAJ0_AZOBR|nr:hypothetical protein D3867_36605 [Azospirillum argentinense]